MARKVGIGSKRKRSTAKAHAAKAPTNRQRSIAKKDYVIEDRASQLKKGRTPVLDVTQTKGKHEKIPGTRLQIPTGGNRLMRVIVQDGKKFEPENVRGARKHLSKLAEEAIELARIRGEAVPAAVSAAVLDTKAKKRSAVAAVEKKEQQPSNSKKAKKEDEYQARQKELVKAHEAEVAKEGRKLVSEAWFCGKVIERSSGKALVQLPASSAKDLPDEVVEKIKESSTGVDAGNLVIPLRYGDAKVGVNLQPGVSLRFRIFTTAGGAAGACEAEDAAPKASTAAPKAAAGKKNQKAAAGTKNQKSAKAKAAPKAKVATAPDKQKAAAEATPPGPVL